MTMRFWCAAVVVAFAGTILADGVFCNAQYRNGWDVVV